MTARIIPISRNPDDLELLKRITEEIREARRELNEDLDRWDDLARVVPQKDQQ